MRKAVLILLTFVIGLTCFAGVGVAASETRDIVVIIDGHNVKFPDAKPFMDENNRTLVPVRFVAENLNAKVAWHGDLQRVDIALDGSYISLTIGEKIAYVNGEEVGFDTAAVIQDGRTFVPLRFVSEALGETVEWDGVNRFIWIGEKVILTPAEKGLEPQPIEDFLEYFEDNPDHFYLHDILSREKFQGIYVIEKSDLPIKISDNITYYSLDVVGERLRIRANMQPIVHYLTDEFRPRTRSAITSLTESRGADFKDFYFSTKLNVDEQYKPFDLSKADYLLNGMFTTDGYGYVFKDPLK